MTKRAVPAESQLHHNRVKPPSNIARLPSRSYVADTRFPSEPNTSGVIKGFAATVAIVTPCIVKQTNEKRTDRSFLNQYTQRKKEEQKSDDNLIKRLNAGHNEVAWVESCSSTIRLSLHNLVAMHVSGHGSIEQTSAYEIRIHVKGVVVPPEVDPSTTIEKLLDDASVLIVETLAACRNDPQLATVLQHTRKLYRRRWIVCPSGDLKPFAVKSSQWKPEIEAYRKRNRKK